MTCRDIQELLRIDDEASTGIFKIKDHLAGCPACREYHALVRKLDADIKAAPIIEPPAYLWKRIQEEVQARPETFLDRIQAWWEELIAGFRPVFVRGSFAAAMLVLLVVATPLLSQRQGAPTASSKVVISPLAYLDDANETAQEEGDTGYGSVVEHLL